MYRIDTKAKIIKRVDSTIAKGIHKGEVTHHQDQLIFPVSLRTRKTIKRPDVNEIPELVVLFSILFD
jgi:hypothetical protein